MSLRRRMMVEQPPKKLYLYNYGDECVNVTGGWTDTRGYNRGGGMILTKLADSMLIEWQYGQSAKTISTVNELDFTPYSRLCALIHAKNSDGNGSMNYVFASDLPLDISRKFPYTAIAEGVIDKLDVFTVDVTNEMAQFHKTNSVAALVCDTWAGNKISNRVYQVWLE